jgi:flagellar biosynthesis protein FlhG
MKILPIASGKGGVGKTSLAANLAIVLAKQGAKVLLLDLDLGGSNLHLLLGEKTVKQGIGTYLLADPKPPLHTLIMETDFPGVQFIPGDIGIPGLANIPFSQKKALIDNLLQLQADYMILDLGAGSHFNTIDFFLMSGSALLITSPHVASTVTAYLFLKNVLFRIIVSSFPSKSPGGEFIQKLKSDGLSLQKLHVRNLISELKQIDPENAVTLEKVLNHFHPFLVMNLLDEPKDATKAERLRKSISHYLGVEMDFLGVIFRDEAQGRAMASGLPITVYKPDSVMSQGVQRIAKRFMQNVHEKPDRLMSVQAIENSHHVVLQEAESDYQDKINSIEDLYVSGALSQGDILETLRVQQYEVNQLRKENRWLKNKIHDLLQQLDINATKQ